MGKMMAWSMSHPEFRTAMLRFVDVFPCLSNSALVKEHMREYFSHEDQRDAGASCGWVRSLRVMAALSALPCFAASLVMPSRSWPASSLWEKRAEVRSGI